uniref:Uncharacterized protein n=1 Tax=Setaria digitata TaxID=48799 RepID=A0A915PNB5_9BILA
MEKAAFYMGAERGGLGLSELVGHSASRPERSGMTLPRTVESGTDGGCFLSRSGHPALLSELRAARTGQNGSHQVTLPERVTSFKANGDTASKARLAQRDVSLVPWRQPDSPSAGSQVTVSVCLPVQITNDHGRGSTARVGGT